MAKPNTYVAPGWRPVRRLQEVWRTRAAKAATMKKCRWWATCRLNIYANSLWYVPLRTSVSYNYVVCSRKYVFAGTGQHAKRQTRRNKESTKLLPGYMALRRRRSWTRRTVYIYGLLSTRTGQHNVLWQLLIDSTVLRRAATYLYEIAGAKS